MDSVKNYSGKPKEAGKNDRTVSKTPNAPTKYTFKPEVVKSSSKHHSGGPRGLVDRVARQSSERKGRGCLTDRKRSRSLFFLPHDHSKERGKVVTEDRPGRFDRRKVKNNTSVVSRRGSIDPRFRKSLEVEGSDDCSSRSLDKRIAVSSGGESSKDRKVERHGESREHLESRQEEYREEKGEQLCCSSTRRKGQNDRDECGTRSSERRQRSEVDDREGCCSPRRRVERTFRGEIPRAAEAREERSRDTIVGSVRHRVPQTREARISQTRRLSLRNESQSLFASPPSRDGSGVNAATAANLSTRQSIARNDSMIWPISTDCDSTRKTLKHCEDRASPRTTNHEANDSSAIERVGSSRKLASAQRKMESGRIDEFERKSSRCGTSDPGGILYRSRSSPQLSVHDSGVASGNGNRPATSRLVADLRQLLTLKQHYYPEGGWGWVIVVVGVLVQILSHGIHGSVGVILQQVQMRFDSLVYLQSASSSDCSESLTRCASVSEHRLLLFRYLEIFIKHRVLWYIAQCTIKQHYYPESGWGWVVVVTGVMVHVLAAGISGAAGIWLAEGMRKYRQPLVNVGWLGAMSTGVALLVSPVTIAFCRKKSTRVTAVLGGLVTALGCLFTSFASQFHQLFFSYGTVVGIGVGMTRDCSTLMVAQYFKRRREFVEIFIVSGSGLGIAVMSAFIKGAISKIGWRLGLQAVTGVVFLTFILGTFYRSASLYHPQRRAILHLKNQKRKIKDKNRADNKPPFFDFSTLKSKTVRILLVSTGISAFGINTPIFYLAHQAEEEGLGDTVILLQTYLGLAWTLGCVTFGLLVVHHSVECRIARQYLTQAAVFMCGLCILALTAVHGNYHGYVMFTWIYGIFCGGYHYSLKMYTFERVRARNFARTWGFVQCSQAIPIAIGVPISGYMNVGCGGKAGYYFSSTCVLVGSFTLFFIDLHRRNLSRHKHTRANGTRHLCVSDNCPHRRRLSFTQDPENEGAAAGAAAAALMLGAELAPGPGEIIDALGADKPELTCISEEGIADMDLPDNLLDDLDYIGDCITSCNKVENYLMLSEFENNLIAEMPIIMDRKGRRWSLARSKPSPQASRSSANDNGNADNGNGQTTTVEEDDETKLKCHLASAPNNRIITVIDETST